MSMCMCASGITSLSRSKLRIARQSWRWLIGNSTIQRYYCRSIHVGIKWPPYAIDELNSSLISTCTAPAGFTYRWKYPISGSQTWPLLANTLGCVSFSGPSMPTVAAHVCVFWCRQSWAHLSTISACVCCENPLKVSPVGCNLVGTY